MPTRWRGPMILRFAAPTRNGRPIRRGEGLSVSNPTTPQVDLPCYCFRRRQTFADALSASAQVRDQPTAGSRVASFLGPFGHIWSVEQARARSKAASRLRKMRPFSKWARSTVSGDRAMAGAAIQSQGKRGRLRGRALAAQSRCSTAGALRFDRHLTVPPRRHGRSVRRRLFAAPLSGAPQASRPRILNRYPGDRKGQADGEPTELCIV